MINAAITPGIHPQTVKINTIKIDPQPLSITARGGKRIESNTLQILIVTNLQLIPVISEPSPTFVTVLDLPKVCTYIRVVYAQVSTANINLLMLFAYGPIQCTIRVFGLYRPWN